MADPTTTTTLRRPRATRKPFEVRRAEIVRKAASFFAQSGFDATTRDLAEWLGTTQPLMYRYFPSKSALIEEIYQTVFLESWNPDWDAMLADRSRPLAERLCAFYDSYTDAIMHPEWMRIYLFAGLKGVTITGLYIERVEERIIIPIVREMGAEKNQTVSQPIDPKLLELAWSLQGGIFYYGVRKYVYQTPVHEEKQAMIASAVDIYVRSWPGLNVT